MTEKKIFCWEKCDIEGEVYRTVFSVDGKTAEVRVGNHLSHTTSFAQLIFDGKPAIWVNTLYNYQCDESINRLINFAREQTTITYADQERLFGIMLRAIEAKEVCQ